jgi:hypothetical protein
MGPAIGRLPEILLGLGEKATDEVKAHADIAAIQAFADIFQSTQPEDLALLIRDLVQTVSIRRQSGEYDQCDFDGDFTGKQADIIPIVVWVLQEQFGDFFSGLPVTGSRNRTRKR